jgi:hypothetical protein
MRMSFQLAVSEGRVCCPVRNTEVDVEQCLACGSFKRVRSGNLMSGAIVCKNERADLLPSPSPYGSLNVRDAWWSR